MKRTLILFLCIATFALIATSCHTRKCPAYGHYSEVVKQQELYD